MYLKTDISQHQKLGQFGQTYKRCESEMCCENWDLQNDELVKSNVEKPPHVPVKVYSEDARRMCRKIFNAVLKGKDTRYTIEDHILQMEGSHLCTCWIFLCKIRSRPRAQNHEKMSINIL